MADPVKTSLPTEHSNELTTHPTSDIETTKDLEHNVDLQRTVSSVAPNYPSPAKLAVILASLYVSVCISSDCTLNLSLIILRYFSLLLIEQSLA